MAEGAGLEPARGFPRWISSPLPYQLGLTLQPAPIVPIFRQPSQGAILYPNSLGEQPKTKVLFQRFYLLFWTGRIKIPGKSMGEEMKTIIQKIKFKAVPKTLFEMYMDLRKHSQLTGAKAVLSGKAGGKFSAHGGYCWGKNLAIVPGKMIVQTWRADDWTQKDPDSILVLTFEPVRGGGLVTMVHANAPDRHAKHLNQGWKDHYWKHWQSYLKNQGK